ncbi:hypothetical protein C8A01DRAFT_21401 [Parachaetomium inaequale]|uniref:Uncharacterized protein n=1 Tax=Parachaetomium inaequale TaxID=2588326 RepID=A0AAN6P6L0_9PEZI|nr:hypothetical protein C8A01DRAFT_21401 [Parachaetomium inaequale]
MVLPTCFVNIPALPTALYSGALVAQPWFAYAPTHTNYFGATSCGLSSYVKPTPSTAYQPSSTAPCTLPPSVSGSTYSVTPVIYVPRTTSSTLTYAPYTCDAIPAASINKGNFKFACKGLRGKDVGYGLHTISWSLPTDAGSIQPVTFWARPPTSTPKYVVNTALARTTLVPVTSVTVHATRTETMTPVSYVRIPTATSTYTCFVTVTATPVASPPLRHNGNDTRTDSDPEIFVSDSVVAHDDGNGNGNNDDTTEPDTEIAAATPTIGRPDYTYPPYGVTTIYVKSFSTRTTTWFDTVYKTAPAITSTTSYLSYTVATVTVTRTPSVSQSTAVAIK